ncbi:MAG: MGMT family protein [Sulfolobales archaeon]
MILLRWGRAIEEKGSIDVRQILYTLLMLIPVGSVTTYASLAKAIGTSPRAVGRLLAMNDNPVIIPCHRVVKSDGSLGGYTPGGPVMKRRILELEGVRFRGEKVDPGCMIDIATILGVNGERSK